MNRITHFCFAAICGLVISPIGQSSLVAQVPSPSLREIEEELEPEEKELELMLQYMESNIPGPELERFFVLNGNWAMAIDFWPGPESQVSKSEGSAEVRPLLGGRFIQFQKEGELKDFPFRVLEIAGYDKSRRVYYIHTFDTMGKAGVVLQGSYDAERDRIVFKGTYFDRIKNRTLEIEYILQFIESYQFITELYLNHPNPQKGPYLSRRILFTREG
jgi:hypothetical protein